MLLILKGIMYSIGGGEDWAFNFLRDTKKPERRPMHTEHTILKGIHSLYDEKRFWNG